MEVSQFLDMAQVSSALESFQLGEGKRRVASVHNPTTVHDYVAVADTVSPSDTSIEDVEG